MPPPTCVAKTHLGSLRGLADDHNGCSYLGVPYAAPPLDALRFSPPRPHKRWRGTRDATQYGHDCWQLSPGPRMPYDERTQHEDCLTLNVHVPASVASRRRSPLSVRKLPVLVFIHGGAFREGSASSPLYEASELARRGGLVVVTFNYRLGPFGFLVSTADGVHGNAGLWDQRAALSFVSRNAAAFGGDAGSVTLSGESAGAMSIAVHLSLNESAALFQRAIMQSAPMSYRYRSVRLANKLSLSFRKRLGCDSLLCMQEEPAAACAAAGVMVGLPRAVGDFLYWGPVHGGRSGVPHDPTMWHRLSGSGMGAGVPGPRPKPLLIGSNAHEGVFFTALGWPAPMPRAAYMVAVTLAFRRTAVGVLAQYASLARIVRGEINEGVVEAAATAALGDHREVYSQILTDYMFRCATRRSLVNRHAAAERYLKESRTSAAAAPTYVYHFTQPSRHTGPDECLGRACHMSELPFVFHRTPHGVPRRGEFSPAEKALSDSIIKYWAAFARTGDPNDGSRGRASMPTWPAWTPHSRAQLIAKWPLEVDGGACDEDCDVWDARGYLW